MFKRSNVIFIAALALTVSWGATVFGEPGNVQWKGIIGIIQAGNTVGTGTGKVTGGGSRGIPPTGVRRSIWETVICSSR
jgi:hypothetical protein